MKLSKVDHAVFESFVRTCSGKVSLKTADGDLLIANGSLSTRIGLKPIVRVAQVQDVEIICENHEDQLRLEQVIVEKQVHAELSP